MSQHAIQRITVLGATGSIGQSTLDVVARHPDRFSVFALSAQRQDDKLLEQVLRFAPRFAVMVDADAAARLRAALHAAGSRTEVLCGSAALEEIAAAGDVDMVMAAIVGAAGLGPALAAARAGKKVLLANKEALVLSGRLFMDAVAESGAVLLPIDSEHNAVFQALPAAYARNPAPSGVRRILLTASGGPFRASPLETLASVTPEQACAHPNWVMGRKISVDSATMMNKGLEVIEAHWLFGAPAEIIEVVVHRQSVIHSMVEYIDGSVIAQLGNPDMRTPIAHAMAWPERIDAGVRSLDLFDVAHLDFERPDLDRFPCLALAFAALRAGGAAPATLNAANEEAVEAFLERRIGFLDIARVIEPCLERCAGFEVDSLDAVLAADAQARGLARAEIRKLSAAR
ncbi:1-deoxy-D-xylulose-5-phosphate reductoisomerase [Thauera linaloolentis]|uniref:1-deoxy-D-xylulose 5-phosphate reductoisomerase n=1 Tax=Thauera linaloolentis (strain DSM 12138 / JCM 21573 / CCUG 41526 / CIP 105981 / IAM 15112 / NBRC 102519 / 47Lol) TaxID=1123367 RepID=N6Z6W6_THAL4|nr:1-deoxy-D-xylulose-5-phosphate reductoisomerase [Thauera linaloolentis]ENO90297.1 1-deoxy-D-xylulose 5-phosphate reductoisomerase [Thauera linaloolentis 47Lol = DSM 12138]MCM8566214.1 1-deoxy-D-xylulose-5-phosphate reductoisomerase [Thauera linaloolentis]